MEPMEPIEPIISNQSFDINPHLLSWDTSLSQKIIEKEEMIHTIKEELKELKIENKKHKDQIEMIQKDINTIFNKVEYSIDHYVLQIQDKIKETKKKLYEENELLVKGNSLFLLFHELYQHAIQFFSKKEFSIEPSELNIDKTSSWLDWKGTIWSFEEIYKTTYQDFVHQENNYQEKRKQEHNLQEKYNQLEKEIHLLYKEKETIKECSEKLKQIK